MAYVKTIGNETDYEAALERIDEIFSALPGTTEGEELESLITLVEAYEAKHHQVEPPDPIEAIKFRMEQMDLRQKDLVEYIGPPSKVSEVLNRIRPLNLRMIVNLSTGLGISTETLLGLKSGRPADSPSVQFSFMDSLASELAEKRPVCHPSNLGPFHRWDDNDSKNMAA